MEQSGEVVTVCDYEQAPRLAFRGEAYVSVDRAGAAARPALAYFIVYCRADAGPTRRAMSPNISAPVLIPNPTI